MIADNECGAVGGREMAEETEVLGKKPSTMPLYTLQIPKT
jgi:hypothetical protein